MHARRYDRLLLDLDGTIVDSAAGIEASIAHALAELGRAIPGPEVLRRFVGPPILEGFRQLGGLSGQDAARAYAIYREHYVEHGLLKAPVFDGMAEFLAAARDGGRPVALATSKREWMAHLVLEHHGLLGCFDVIAGADDEGTRDTKGLVVAEALRRLGGGASRGVLVGDRVHDVEGAAENGIPAVLVAWGYGTPEEARGAVGVARDTAELARMVG